LSAPTWNSETVLKIQGYQFIAGCDEVGMGCLAGPVVAAAVILPFGIILEGLNDSKLMSAKSRESMVERIHAVALSYSIQHATVDEIDELNIYHAARLAMKRAIESLKIPADYALIDGRAKIDLSIPQLSIIKGDQISVSIAAASVLAKVFRDQWMREFDISYPGYEFAKHKGYGSVLHRTHLQDLGPSPIHRKSFSWTPVRGPSAT